MSHPSGGESPRYTNRLVRESSPYLRQHAHNPVDWFPWGEEAFAEARRRSVPIFLSIGYSTCYWCHVMERESFEDTQAAALMNSLFVNVKLDREEHPAVDDLYMAAVQILTGRGGWPMSVFLDPATLKPFWAGTYFPPSAVHGLPAFAQVLRGMSDAFTKRYEDVVTQSNQIAAAVEEKIAADSTKVAHIGRPQAAMAAQTLLTILDRVHGGFGDAPKFPQPVYLELLLDIRARAADATTREAVGGSLSLTLDKMALGGLFDQVGGGFHRYSVDRFWIVPHFEKMLYDQGQLLSVYARAAVELSEPFYAAIARRTADYVLAEMTHPQGAFYTAQDAEVDGREGLNYLWNSAELAAVLSAPDASFATDVYGVSQGPNFSDPHHPDEPASNVLRLADRPEVTAGRMNMPAAELNARMAAINAKLYAARALRKQPRLDDKILTAWNGLMIGGLAQAARLLNEPRYFDAALRAADWIAANLRDPRGGLLRTASGNESLPIAGVLEDYAMFAHGLLSLARSAKPSDRARCLELAQKLLHLAEDRFGDGRGGFFDTTADRCDLFVRARSTYDGAMPSAISVMVNNLVDLFELTGEPAWAERAAAAIASVSTAIAESPIATANSTRGMLRLIHADERALVEGLTSAGATAMPSAASAESAARSPVEIYSSEESVSVAIDEPVEVFLQIKIAEGFHLTAPVQSDSKGDRGQQSSAPLQVGTTSGSGVAVYADYPEGELLDTSDPASPMVYRGTLTFPVAIERVGEWTGEPKLTVAFQPCTQTECQRAVTATLDLAILPKAAAPAPPPTSS